MKSNKVEKDLYLQKKHIGINTIGSNTKKIT